jgi:hypothetical protein
MIYEPSFYPVSCNEYRHLTVPVLLTGRALDFARCVVSFVTYLTLVLTRRAAFQAVAICGVLTLFGVAEAGAQTQKPREYERGIWYDSGVDQVTLGAKKNEVDKLYNEGVRRVHIMVNEKISQKAIRCGCVHESEVTYFTYRNLNPDVKVEVANRYHSCLKRELANESCAKASNYSFEFDRWGPQSAFDRLDRFIQQLNKKNIAVIITIWPEPTSKYIDSLPALISYVASHKIYGIELEDEENWSEVFTEHGSKKELDEAAGKLIAKLKNGLPKINIGVTAAGRGSDFSDKFKKKFINDALLTNPDVAFISFQAYQDTHVGNVCGDPGKISGNYSPSSLAANAIALASNTDQLNTKNLIVGLSAYQLDCPQTGQKLQAKGVAGTVNMYMAAKTSLCAAGERLDGAKARIVGDSYFSEDNVVKQRGKGNFYANNFLSVCRIDSIRTHCEEPTPVADNAEASETLLMSELNRDCPNIINDLTNNHDVTPGEPPGGGREIYIRRQLSQ